MDEDKPSSELMIFTESNRQLVKDKHYKLIFMKLLFFISSMRGGGAERVMSILCNELVSKGYDVVLTTMSDTPSFYSLDERIKRNSLKIKTKANFLDKIIWRLGWYRYIRKTVKQEQPDIIISFIYGLNAPVILSTLGLGIPVIASEHSPFDQTRSFIDKFRRFYINKLAQKVTVLTEYDFNYIGNKLKNKVVIPNPLSFHPISMVNTDRQKTIIAAGAVRRYHIKGFDNLIVVWGKIAHKYPDWKLLIAGDNSDINSLTHLQNLTTRYNIKQQVEFLGSVNFLDKELRKSSIFISSSRYEGFSMVLTEAMSQGCACISFDCTGPTEIITHNVDGLLIPNQNVDKMAEELSILIEDEIKRFYLANNAIKSVEKFSANNIISKWENLFKEMVK